VPLPPDLLNAVVHPGGGQVVLVIGAGCSVEAPTNLPLSRAVALEAHRRLLADGILVATDCANPEDLSCVADAVWTVTGSQGDLIRRLPLEEFKNAEPNEGYLLAAVMLRERAISCCLTLNFDLAITHALSSMGTRDEVAIIAGPEDYARLGTINVIFLHRSANAPPDDWILRSTVLANDWRGHWEEVIVNRFVAGPTTVFAGLGSPATVLLETTDALRNAIRTGLQVYQVDPVPRGSSAFFVRLGLVEDHYLQMGWVTFMRELASRLAEEHRAALERAGQELLVTNGWELEDVASLSRRLFDLGLIELGRLRARWLLEETRYLPTNDLNTTWLADLMLIVGFLERRTGSLAVFEIDGIVEFRRNNEIIGAILIAHGRGSLRWLVLESKIKHSEYHWRRRVPKPRYAVISGVTDTAPVAIGPPKDIVSEDDTTSIVTANAGFDMVSVDQIRTTPELADRLFG
jgi:hypothetical protein